LTRREPRNLIHQETEGVPTRRRTKKPKTEAILTRQRTKKSKRQELEGVLTHCNCRTEDASCCLRITQPSTEISSSGNFCSDLFKDETCQKCGAGWELHGGTCYKFSTRKSSWNESRDSCKDLGGDLVKIDSREEQDNLEDMFWIGLTDSKEEGRWLWVDGSPLSHKSSQPDNKSKDGAAEADCSWFDISCNYPQKSICEKAAEIRQCSCVYG
uniref:C-type lectin domain-containing protein n=1 Tax=Fundulus heteroclitus TaxID=8078 RepID=A0A3Q2QPP5_FUNHE